MFILSQYLTNENIWVIPCPTSQISVLGIDNVKKSHVNYSDERESRFGEPVNGNQQFIFQHQQYHLIMLSDRQPYKKTFARHSPLIKYKMTLGKIWLSLTELISDYRFRESYFFLFWILMRNVIHLYVQNRQRWRINVRH